MASYYLGIDTSNYKTSLAIVDNDKNIIFNKSEFLDVKQGERGLRQSEAFFKQSNNLPAFIKSAFKDIKAEDIVSIGVSSKPRRIEGSYMPCFLAGLNLAKELGSVLNVPVYEFSHQEGHAAAVIESDQSAYSNCLLCHLSGGTTEYLLCKITDDGYDMTIVGGTKDISIGQLLDRLGVEIGCSFPAGKYLDQMTTIPVKSKTIVPGIKTQGAYFNLSGIETKLTKYIGETHSDEEIQLMVSELFKELSDLLYRSIEFARTDVDIDVVYLVGGVSSSESIRYYLKDTDYLFGIPELSGDNAVGIALLARKQYINKR